MISPSPIFFLLNATQWHDDYEPTFFPIDWFDFFLFSTYWLTRPIMAQVAKWTGRQTNRLLLYISTQTIAFDCIQPDRRLMWKKPTNCRLLYFSVQPLTDTRPLEKMKIPWKRDQLERSMQKLSEPIRKKARRACRPLFGRRVVYFYRRTCSPESLPLL